MPELPEVETVARSVNARVRGQKIVAVWVGSKPEPFQSKPSQIVAALTGSTIEGAHRVGKHIVVDLTRSKPAGRKTEPGKWRGQWLVHLGMTGRLLVCQPDVPVPPHTHAIMQLEDDREIRFVDPRRFGRLAVLDLADSSMPSRAGRKSTLSSGFTGTGQEPLEISPEAFRVLFRGRRTPIKSALLNQSLLQGVGNIYADESLYRAGIRPKRHAGRLNGQELARLHASLQAVLREAIALGGSSVSDYVDADGTQGFFQFEHKVYLRTGKPCFACKTPIRRIVLAGRSTHFCPQCQR